MRVFIKYFVCNAKAWKVLADQQFAAIEKHNSMTGKKEQTENNEAMMECLKTAANNVFEEFIPENVNCHLLLSV